MYRSILTITFLTTVSCLLGQDTLLMRTEMATVQDLTPRQQIDRIPKSTLATGEALELSVTPYTTYIVSSEDILRQNISTLTDVMRLIPGVIISSSGSGVEGEKFMVNGLSGNSQMKILINNVPVKPWATNGMPIGSQLPIRQADRIEILLSSASSYFGEEACAGVINIILAESERPVFTRTNLGFGGFGYNDLDLTFGGKLGKDRNIFRFTVYGRSTIQSDRDIFYSASALYNYRNYLLYPNLTTVWERNPNLVLNSPGDSVIAISGAPHESRQFGVMFLWRGIRFRYDLMNRKDYSSIGLNPMAASYRRPGDRIGERIETFSMHFGRSHKRRQTNFLLSALIYSTTENSLKTHVFGAMGQTYFTQLRQDVFPTFNDKLYNRLFDNYYSGQRNVVNQSVDLRMNYRIAFALKNGFTYSLGMTNTLAIATDHSDLYSRPAFGDVLVRVDTLAPIKPFSPSADLFIMSHAYQQLMYQHKRFFIMGGLSGQLLLPNGAFVQKRGAASYRLSKLLTFNAAYGEGFTPISPYYLGNTVLLAKDESETRQLNYNAIQDAPYIIQKSNSWELGVRAQYHNLSGKASLLGLHQSGSWEGGYTETGNSAYGFDKPYVLYGYRNDAGSETQISAIRFEARLDSTTFELRLGEKLTRFEWGHTVNLQMSSGSRTGVADANGARVSMDEVPNYPSWIFKYGTSLVSSKFDLSIIAQWQGASQTNLNLYRARYPRLANRSDLASSRHTIDVMARLFLNKNFSAWLDIRNIFNQRYDGIDAYGTPDDLIFNPQPGRQLRFGVQYNLD